MKPSLDIVLYAVIIILTLYVLFRYLSIKTDGFAVPLNIYMQDNPDYTLQNLIKMDEVGYDKEYQPDKQVIGAINSHSQYYTRKEYELDNLISENKKLDEKIKSNSTNVNSTLVSMHNADNLSITPIGDDSFQLNINNNCLTVVGDKQYDLKNCNVGDFGQKFQAREIADSVFSKYITGYNVLSDHEYPYQIVQSKASPFHCLTGGDNQISLEECNGNNIKQQWQLEKRENPCIDSRDN